MRQFMLFLREDLETVQRMTEDELQADIQAMVKWVEDLSKSGNYVQGDPLEPTVRIAKKEAVISDGPYVEAKEAVSGYLIIKANDIEEATHIAQQCPGLGLNIQSVEVRPVMVF